jgi:hypothetical protein
MDDSQDVNFADIGDYGHRVQIPIGKSLFNLFFRWSRNVGQDRPHAKITTSQVIENTFKTVLVNAFNTSYTDIDGVTNKLHFGTSNLSTNTDPRLRKDGLVSANDIPMAFILYKVYGNSAVQTKNNILNLEDAYDMLSSVDLAETIMNSFKTNEATSLDQMFRDLLSQDPKRFFTTAGVSEPNLFERSTDLAGEGSWKLAVNDIIEIRTKLIFNSKITKRGVAGREHLLSDINSAENQQDIIIPDDFFYIRLQLKVVDDGVVANPVNITYSDSTQTVVTGYTGVINGELIIPEGVTSIAAGAFTGQTGLTEILVPQSLTTIGAQAFKGTGLTTVFMPNVTSIGAQCFQNCASLTTVIAPNLTTVPASAFEGCIALTSLNSFTITEGFADVNTTTANSFIQVSLVINLSGITSLGSAAFANCQSIESVILPTTITVIPANLFSGAVSLETVNIPTTVTTIASGAFSNTASLEEVVIPTSVTTIESQAFAGAGLTSITLHSGVTTIGSAVFSNATNLLEVTILAPITTLPANIFEGASSLTTVELPPTITIVAEAAFKGTAITEIVLPNVVTIQANAFANVTTLEVVEAPSIQVVSNTAFAGSTSIQEAPADPSSIVFSDSTNTVVTGYTGSVGTLKLPATVTAIAANAFLNNVNVIGLNIISPITTIGANAFKGSALRSINLPAGLTTIGNNAFQNCTNLTTVTLPSGSISLGTHSFAGCSALTSLNLTTDITAIPAHCFNGCSNIVNLNIHSGITSIGEYAFNGCAKLASVTIPPAITTLLPYTFGGCVALTSITLPLTLTNYQTGCFFGCSGLTSITFPEVTTTNIGDQALGNCTGLTSVTFPNKASTGGAFPLTLGTAVLIGCTGLTTFTVPSQWTSLPNSFFENSGLTSATVPNTITTMGTGIFKGCAALTTATIEAAITTLPSATFQNCTSLTTVNLPSTVTVIDTQAFRNSRITAFVNSVITTIRDYAFADNPSIVTLNAPNVTSLAITSISGASNLGDINVSNLPSARVHYRATTYSGSGAWTNVGTLGATHNATVASGTPTKNSAGNGIIFNGSLRYTFPSMGTIPQYTQSVWIRRTTTARSIMGQNNWSSGNIGAGIQADWRRNFYGAFNSNNVWYYGPSVAVDVAKWSHLVVTYNGSSMTMYLNGQFVNRTTWSGVTHTDNGISYNIGSDFRGELGEVRFYNIALNADQVQFLYMFTANGFQNPTTTPPTEMMIRYNASTYSGSGAWTNTGTLGSTYDAVVNAGTPSKNTAGNGVVFNGGLYFRFPTVGPLINYTQSVWFKRTAQSGWILGQQYEDWGHNSGPNISADNRRSFNASSRTSYTDWGGAGVDTNLNQWYNITFVYNNFTMFTYLNGYLVDRRTLADRYVETTPNNYFLGANWSGQHTFRGEIGEFRFYNGPLTGAEVLSLYNSTVSNYTNTPIAKEMWLCYNANNYSGSGAWTNTGTRGSAFNATVRSGTPSKNTVGDGIVFKRNLSFQFPNIGMFTQYTISVWFKRTGQSGWIMAQHYDDWSHQSGLYINADRRRAFWLGSRTAYSDWTNNAIDTDLNTWCNMIVTFNGTTMQTYKDGILVETKYYAGRFVEPNHNVYFIGSDWWGNNSFYGELGELRLYSGALTTSEVTTLYNSTVGSYTNTPLPENLRLCYTAGTYSGSGAWTNTGTLGTAFNATVRSGTPSKNTDGNGVIFKRNLSFQIPNIEMFTKYTLSVWIKRTGLSGWIFTQYYDDSSHQVGLGINAGNNRFFWTVSRTAYSDWGVGAWETDLNRWHHLVATFDGSTGRVYRDGVLMETNVNITRFVEANYNAYFLGADWWGNNTLHGELGEFRLYSSALTQQEVLDIYNTTATLYPNPTVSPQMLLQFSGSSYSGSGAWTNTGTLGTTHNAVIHTGTPSKNGNAVVFNGGLIYKIPNVGPLPRFTMSVWLMRTGSAKWVFAQEYDWSFHTSAPFLGGDNERNFWGRMQLAQTWYGGGHVSTDINTWYHVVVTFDGTKMFHYLNGVMVGNATILGGYSEPNFNQYILGASWTWQDLFVGRIGEFRLYNGALTENEVKDIFNTSVSSYTIPAPPPTPTVNMLVQFNASTYSGSGAWPNTGTLGSTHDAVINNGTPVKNSAGNGVVFKRDLMFRFPSTGALTTYTQSLWIKRTGRAGAIIAQRHENTGHILGVIENNLLRGYYPRFFKSWNWYSGNAIDIERDTWAHLVFTWTGTQFFSYLNGALIGFSSVVTGVTTTDSGRLWNIGGNNDSWSTFHGEIGEIRIYSGAMNDAQVKTLYDETVANYPNTPVTRELKVHYLASSYSGTGAWTNLGTLGTTHNAAVQAGTPSKNTAGNGVVFNGGLRFGFPSIGSIPKYTQVFWLKRTGWGGTLISQQNIGVNGWAGLVEVSQGRYFYARNVYWGGGSEGGWMNTDTDTWYHFVFVFDGMRYLTYVNGVLRNIANRPGAIAEETEAQYFLGAQWDGWGTFIGEIGEFRFYNDVVSSEEVAQLYSSSVATYTPLIANIPTEMKIRYVASSYSGSGAWTNLGTLGTSHNATIGAGTPSKNTAGNGVVFNGGLRYHFPNIGPIPKYTLSVWLKRTGWGGTLFSQQNNGRNTWVPMIEAEQGRYFYTRFYYSGGWAGGAWVEADYNVWYNLTFVWTGSQFFTYVDGVLRNIVTATGALAEQNGAQYFIGAQWDAGISFIGELGEFRFYNGALSPQEVAQIYTSTVATYTQAPPDPTELILRFNATSYSGTGTWSNTGTLGSTHNATVGTGTPRKNTAGNGVVFNTDLRFQFPSFGSFKDYSISVWIKRTGLARTLLCQQNNGRNTWALNITGDGARQYMSRFYWVGGWYNGAWVDTEQEVWYNLTFVHVGQQTRTYVDGVLSFITQTGGPGEQNGSQYFIGAQWDAWAEFIGELGDLRIYRGALTDQGVLDIYNETTTIYPNLTPVTELKLHYTGTNYSGSGAWTNIGTLGTTHNAVVGAGTPSKSGNGVVFNGGLRFNIPHFGPIPRYTQALWIKRANSSMNVIFSQQNVGNGFIAGGIHGNGGTGLTAQIHAWSSWQGSASINLANLNTWYHVTFVFNGKQFLAYLNGEIQGIVDVWVRSEQTWAQYFLGANWEATPTFNGQIGEFRFYNGVLDSTQIRELYNSTASTFV